MNFKIVATTIFLILFSLVNSSEAVNPVTSNNEGNSVERFRRDTMDDQIVFFLRQTLTNLKSVMKTGAPEIGMPPMDPLRTRDFQVDTKEGSAKIKANFTKLLVYGLSNFEIRDMHVNINSLKMDLILKFPNMTITGMYDMNGKVAFVIPVYGRGKFETEATDVIVTGFSALKTLWNGTLVVQNLLMDMSVDKIHVHFHDLFGGGPLSGAANAVVNLFGKKIFDKAKPRLIERLTTSIQNNLNSKLANFNIGKLAGRK